MEIPLFKIRAHASGKITAGEIGLTNKQAETLQELITRQLGYEAGEPKIKPLTPDMEKELAKLIYKRDNPELPAGAKTYCKKWCKEQKAIYNRSKKYSNKYTKKGILCEPSAIELVAEIMGYGMVEKNTVRKSNDYMEGECDLLLADMVEDVKNSWEPDTFPLFETQLPESDYYYQLQCYMELYGRKKGAVNYCLIDAPEEIINQQAWYVSREAGFEEIEMELYDEVKAKMTFGDIPKQLKHKRFEFDRNEAVIQEIKDRVVMCRKYIETIWPTELLTQINKAV